MVHEQGEVIDSIEANVESAQVHVSQGAGQLQQARQYQVFTYFFSQGDLGVCILIVSQSAFSFVISFIIYYNVWGV